MSASTRPLIAASIVGVEVGPVRQAIDARWLMAYAAGLGLDDPRYYDTLGSDGPAAHPLFPVCYEWPVALEIRARTIEDAIATRSVHATHHTILHRPPRAGDTLFTSARVIAVTRRRAGTLVTTRFTTIDGRGAPVTTTDYGSVYRGVDCDGDAHLRPCRQGGEVAGISSRPLTPVSVGAWTTRRGHRTEAAPSGTTAAAVGGSHAPEVRWTEAVAIPAWAAHVYTECARIWNPIHTDLAVAKAAGLPTIILHGTATLALVVSRVIARDLGGDPARVHEIATRFTGMVLMPSVVTIRGLAGEARDGLSFDALDAEGGPVLSDAWLKS